MAPPWRFSSGSERHDRRHVLARSPHQGAHWHDAESKESQFPGTFFRYYAARSLIATRSIARLLEEEHRACFWPIIRPAMRSC